MSSRPPAVSVIVPCRNGEVWIREALESVRSQALVDIETIVVDDGSSDRSGDVVRREFPEVRLIRIEPAGPSRARNVGTQAACGRFIQYLDCDDLLAPGKLKAQLEALEKSGASVAYGDWQEWVRQPNGAYRAGRLIQRELRGALEVALFTDFWCPPAVYLFRWEIVEKVGAWNEGLPVIQDARFVLDCALQGGTFVYRSQVMAYYRVHASGSVSTTDPIAFARDCFLNATEIEAWWARGGPIGGPHRKALLKVYGFVARGSFKKDRDLFEKALQALERLQPRYVPEQPIHLAMASRLFGYRQAEWIALYYRKAKRFLSRF